MRKLLGGLIVLCCIVTTAYANSFVINFDTRYSGQGTVFTGTFGFSQVLGDGTWSLVSDLGTYNINFAVGSSTFTNADITTPLSEILVVIYGGGTQINFDNIGLWSGPHAGSIDFGDSGPYLTTAPSYSGLPLNEYQAVDSSGDWYYGVYQTVPEPTTLVLLACGLGVIGLAARRKRS